MSGQKPQYFIFDRKTPPEFKIAKIAKFKQLITANNSATSPNPKPSRFRNCSDLQQ